MRHQDYDNLKSGFGGQFRAGQRFALLVVDFQRGFTEPGLTPLAADCSAQIAQTEYLLELFRPHGPIIFTICGYGSGLLEAGRWLEKCDSLGSLALGSPACDLDPRLSCDTGQGDLIITKNMPSAFFGTSLAATLTAAKIDSILITGCTTSGCVRASTLDALQNGFAPYVIEDACADRSQAQHQSNLIDLQSKYADVIQTTEATKLLDNGAQRAELTAKTKA